MIIIGVICIAVLVAIILFIVYSTKPKEMMSFKESIDLTELPIVTFLSGDKKLNFLLDTGSNNSLINASILDKIQAEALPYKSTSFGAEGTEVETPAYNIKFQYKSTSYKVVFFAMNLDVAFDKVKKESGVTIHGILGNKFFERYKYVLDFESLKVYNKK
jgi:hypothetical protein